MNCGNNLILTEKSKHKMPIIIACIVASVLILFIGLFFLIPNLVEKKEDLPENQVTEITTEHSTEKTIEKTTTLFTSPHETTTQQITTNSNPTHEIKFDQEQINTYITNLTETGINSFVGTPADNELVSFVYMHSFLNYNPDVSGIEYGDYNINNKYYNIRVDSSYLEHLILRFFGIKKSASQFNDPRIHGDHLYTETTGGDHSNGIAIVDKVIYDNSTDTYKAEFSVYISYYQSNESEYYSYTPDEAKADSSLQYIEKGYAVIEKYISDGKEAYRIIEYMTNI